MKLPRSENLVFDLETNLPGLSCQSLLQLFEDAPVFVALATAPDWLLLYANKAWRDLVKRADVVGRSVSELLPEIQEQGYLELLDEACRTRRPVVRHGSPLVVRPDATSEELKYVDFTYQPIMDRSGAAVAIFATGYDVTVAHRATVEAARLTEELYETRRSILVEGLAATLSHELKQPLSASTNYLGAAGMIVRRSDFDNADQVGKMISAAQEQVQRAGDIINGLRALSGARLAQRVETDLLRLVQDVVNSVTASGICKNVQFKLHRSDHDLPLSCDPAQVFKILGNLVRNACRAMGSNGGEIQISACRADHDMIEISVEDEGPGFSEELLTTRPRIGHSTTGGLGIGLALSEALVQAHGGQLILENHKRGARVRFTVPEATG